MGTEYIVPGVNTAECLLALQSDNDIIVTDEGDYYKIVMPVDKRYSLQKRMAIARLINIPGDSIQQGSDRACVFLNKTEDEENTWFSGYGTSVNHPEVVLERLLELLEAKGIDTQCFSEHDEEYWNYMDIDEEDDEEEEEGD